jgi:uncharacterized SAM-binding protein YcdF (DUF218 family)
MRTAIIVLGYPSTRRGRPHPVQILRVRRAARLLARHQGAWLIITGGPTKGSVLSEASVMGRYATSVLGIRPDLVQLEERAVSTWENVQFSIPLAEEGGAEQFVFASQPWHAARARRYLRRQRPDLSI